MAPQGEIRQVVNLIPGILGLEHKQMWTSYDKEADVLYVTFERPARADDSVMTDDDILVRYKGKKIVGYTVLNAAARMRGAGKR